MAVVQIESCINSSVSFRVINWSYTTTPGLVFNIVGDTVMPDGCYTIGSSSMMTITMDGTATLVSDCDDHLCTGYCQNNYCIDIPIESYSGYNGTYTLNGIYGSYNYWTGGTSPGYLFFNGTNWCLSDSLGGSCDFFGQNPTTSECPDLDITVMYEGTCNVVPIPTDPCSDLDFDVLLECDIPTPTPTPGPDMCFTLDNEYIFPNPWQCVLNYSGFLNGKPYYDLLYSGCSTSTDTIVYWNNTTVRWEQVYTPTATLIAYNDNPAYYPESSITYPWANVVTTPIPFRILSSDYGVCVTPTPTPTPDICSAFTVSLSFSSSTVTPTPTPTPTPSPTPCPVTPSADTVTFVVDSGNFVCSSVKELKDCYTNDYYYITEPLTYSGSVITTGTTFLAILFGNSSNQIQCVTYVQNTTASSNRNLVQILDVYSGGCVDCVLPTPTPTPTPIPNCYCYTVTANSGCTITWTGCSGNSETLITTGDTTFGICAQENSVSFSCVTGTTTIISGGTCTGDTECALPTPPSYPMGTQFIFTSCTNNTMIIQNAYPPINAVIGDILKTTGDCYNYIGNYVGYTPPPGFISVVQDTFTATTATTYTTCLECLTPEPTPTPKYKEWRASGEFSLSCPICELTNFGVAANFFTSFNVNTIQTGVYAYEDSSLTTPLSVTYIKVPINQSGNAISQIFEVDGNGKLTFRCTPNGNC